jgi:hypothetical protein
MRILLCLCLVAASAARAQIPLLLNESDSSILFPTGAIGGTLSASNISIVRALTIGGQTLSNLVGSGLTNANGTLQAMGGGGGGSGTVTSIGATSAVVGLSFSGSPVTTAGTLGLTGVVGAASIDTNIARLSQVQAMQASLVASNLWQATNAALTALAANPAMYQATNGNLTIVANLTGGTSSNFLSGDGTFKQVTTNAIPGLVGDIAKLATIASPAFTGNPTASTTAADDNDASIATTAYVQTELAAYPTDTVTWQNKTFDAAATGNVLKQTKHLYLIRPDYSDGAGAVPQTNSYVASGLMHYTFSGNAETNVNWVVYETVVPPDIDTSVPLTATFKFTGSGSDPDALVFHFTYGEGVAGSAFPPTIASLPIVMTVTPTSPAAGVLQSSGATTLTGWAAALTPGRTLAIKVARLQNSADDSARDVLLDIAYGSTQ